MLSVHSIFPVTVLFLPGCYWSSFRIMCQFYKKNHKYLPENDRNYNCRLVYSFKKITRRVIEKKFRDWNNGNVCEHELKRRQFNLAVHVFFYIIDRFKTTDHFTKVMVLKKDSKVSCQWQVFVCLERQFFGFFKTFSRCTFTMLNE